MDGCCRRLTPDIRIHLGVPPQRWLPFVA
jgi:hypothetical protein